MTQTRFAGFFSLAIAAFATFWVWLTPLNKYAWEGPTSIPPDPDTVLVLTLLSIAGFVAAAVAVWRSRLAPRSAARWSIAAIAVVLGVYDLVRFIEAVPHFAG